MPRQYKQIHFVLGQIYIFRDRRFAVNCVLYLFVCRFFCTSKLHVEKFTLMCQCFRKIALNPSLTCDVITTSLKSHVSHFIHLITFFEAIPIDCHLD